MIAQKADTITPGSSSFRASWSQHLDQYFFFNIAGVLVIPKFVLFYRHKIVICDNFHHGSYLHYQKAFDHLLHYGYYCVERFPL